MTTANWEMGYLGQHGHGHHGGGHHGGGGGWGGGMWYGGPGYIDPLVIMPVVPQCPPDKVMTVEGVCVKRPKPKLMGQFNPLQTIAQATMSASGINTGAIQQDIQNISKDVEMYAYAQLGLQTLATAATFGIFLMMFYNFTKKKKAGVI